MPSRFQLPPIVKAAERLLVDIENAVRRFPRYHRYQIGADLREQAMAVYKISNRAWRDRAQQHRWVVQLVWAVDELKQYMQTAKLLHAFKSFRQLPFSGKISTRSMWRKWHAQAVPRNDAATRRTPWPDVHRLADHEGALPQSERHALRPLWRARDHSLQPLAGIRTLLGRHGRAATRNHARPHQQRWALRAGELPLGVSQGERPQSFGQSPADLQRPDQDACRVGGEHRAQPFHAAGSREHGLDGRADSGYAIPCAHSEPHTDREGRQQAAGTVVRRTWPQPAHRAAPAVQARHDSSGSTRPVNLAARAADIKLQPLADGIDFLGYVIHPAYTRVRQRVITHVREALQVWETEHVRAGQLRGTPEDFRHIRSVVASYQGHLRHANSHRLQQQLLARFPWITAAVRPRRFSHRLEGRRISLPYRSNIDG